MAKDKLIEKLQSYHVDSDETKKQELIELGKVQLSKNQRSHTSMINLFFSTFRFISLRTWVIQFLVIGFAFYWISVQTPYTPLVTPEQSVPIILDSYYKDTTLLFSTALLLISALFLFDEIIKSFTSGVWELEQTLKYDLRQQILVKLMIFGFLDLFLIVILALATQAKLSIAFYEVALYLLVPFNLFIIMTFAILTRFRNKSSSSMFLLGSGIFAFVFVLCVFIFGIYQLSMITWVIAYVVTLITLIFTLKSMFNENKWKVA